MPLQKQQFELSFNSGLDLKTDEKLVLPAKLLTLENGIFVKGGTIQKRYGYSYYLSDYKPIWGLNTVNWDLTPKSLNSYQSELLMSTNKSLLSYGLEKDFWMEKDNISPFIATYETIINDKLSKDRPDMVISNGVEVYAYNDSEGVKCTVIDSVSKTVYQYNTLLDATGHSARVVSVGNSVFIFYISSTGTYSILGKKIDTAYPHTLAQNYLELPTVTTTFTIGANNSDGHLLDAITVGNKAFVVWSKKVSGTNPPLIRMSYVAASGATASGVGISLPTAKDIPNSYATTSLTCLYNNINKTIWIAVGNNPTTQIPSTKTNPGLYACILDTNLTLTTGTNLPAILPFTKIDNDVTWDIVNLTGEFITDNLVKWFYEYEARDIYSLANTIKYSYNAHLIDITQHTFADTTHKVTAPDATDLTSLGTLLTQMHAKYVLHDDDAELAGGWSYHYAQEAADHSLAALGGLGSLALCRVCILDMVLKIGSPTGHINDATAHNYGGRHLITATESVTDLNRIYTNILSQTRIVGNREVFKLNVGLATKAFYQDISDRSNDYVYSLASVTGLANGIITVSSSIFNVGDYVLIADTSSVPATGYIVGITDIGGTPTEYELHIQTLPINGTDVDLSMYSTGDSAFIIAIPSDKIYVGVTYASPLASINEFLDDLQPSYFILDSRGKVRGKLLSQKGIGYMSHPLPSITEVGDKYYCSLGQSLRLESDASSVVRSVDGVSVVEMDFDSSYLNFGKEINNIFYFTGAQVESYDGSAVVEAGFHTFPEGITITTVSSGGFIEDGDHIYKTIWRWRDRRGNLHRSSPSFGVTMTSAGGSDSTNTLIIPSLTITNKSDVVCEIYRNILLGSTFYKVGEVANNSLTETITFADTLADSSIDSKELLYTLGGELENIAPPSCRLIDIWKNRIFVVTDDEFIWYTKERYDNIAMEFNDFGFTKYIHPEGGKTSAIVGLDSNLILFKQERIYFINGEGANSFGQNGNLSDMQLITTDVGCIDPNSVVIAPTGILFKSKKGIYILKRDLTTEYVGAPVENYNSNTVLSAVLHQSANELRFLLDNNKVLVWNYFFNQWSVFTNMFGLDSTIFNDNYVYLRSNGMVFWEDTSKFTDIDVPIQLKIETAWIKTAGIQGFQRIYWVHVLGDYLEAHQLNMTTSYNYSDSQQTSTIWTPDTVLGTTHYGDDAFYGVIGSVYGGTSDGVYQYRSKPSIQKCESIKFTFYDTNSLGRGYSLSNLMLTVGIKGTGYKLRANKTIGK